jgi:membrane protein DedA with SNARE-associated domain
MNLVTVILIGTIAAITGESLGFLLGRHHGKRLVRRVPFVGQWLSEKLEQSEEYFKKHGGLTVAIGRYATAAGAFIPFTAGAGKMSYCTFILYDAPAILIWAAGISIFGYAFGQHLDFIDKTLSRFGYIVLGLVLIFFLGRFLWRRWRSPKAVP